MMPYGHCLSIVNYYLLGKFEVCKESGAVKRRAYLYFFDYLSVAN